MSTTNNCVPFDRTRARRQRKGASAPDALTDVFDHLSPAQYAFLSGVLAILAEHGEEAVTTSCEMVIARFGRGHRPGPDQASRPSTMLGTPLSSVEARG